MSAMLWHIALSMAVFVASSGPECPCECEAMRLDLVTKFSETKCINDSLIKAAAGFDPARGQGKPIKLEFLSWRSQWISTLISAFLLRDVLNYEIDFACTDSGFNSNPRIANGHSDVLIEFWLDTYLTEAREYINSKQTVTNVGFLGYDGRSGIFVPKYMEAYYTNITSPYAEYVTRTVAFWQSLTLYEIVQLYATQNDSNIVNDLVETASPFTPPWCSAWNPSGEGNNCMDIKAENIAIDIGQVQQMIVNLGLNCTISYWGTRGLETYLSRKMDRSEPVIFKYWTPVRFLAGLPITRVSFPEYSQSCHRNNTGSITGEGSIDCDFPRTSTRKIARTSLISKDITSPYYALTKFLQSVVILEETMDELLLYERRHMNTTDEVDTACHYLETRVSTWVNWIPELECRDSEAIYRGECVPPPLTEDKNQIPRNALVFSFAIAGIVLLLALISIIWTSCNLFLPVVVAAQPFFLIQIAVGCMISTTSVFFAGVDDSKNLLMRPSLACNLQLWFYCIGFSLTYSGLLTKVWRVQQVLVHAKKCQQRSVSITEALRVVLGIVAIEVFMIGIWTAVHGFSYRRHCDSIDEFGRCESSRGFCDADEPWSILGPIVALHAIAMSYALYLSYETRHIPNLFSETQWVSTAMVSNFQISVMGVFLLFILRGDPTQFFIVLTFIVVLSDGSVLLLIFLPKLHITYFKRGMDDDGNIKKMFEKVADEVKSQQKALSTPSTPINNNSLRKHDNVLVSSRDNILFGSQKSARAVVHRPQV